MCKIPQTDMFLAFYIHNFIVLANVAKIKRSRIKDGLQYLTVPMGATFTKLTPAVQLIPHGGLCH